MRISDWSSDVCSSDLSGRAEASSECLRRAGCQSSARRAAPLPPPHSAAGRAFQGWEFRRRSGDGPYRHPTRTAGQPVGVVEKFWWNRLRSEEHTSELQSLMRISYAVFCLKKKQRKQETL